MCLTLSKIICTLPQSPDIFRALVHVVVNFEYRLEAGLGLIWVELAQKCNELVIGAICLPQLPPRVSTIIEYKNTKIQKYKSIKVQKNTKIQKYKNIKIQKIQM